MSLADEHSSHLPPFSHITAMSSASQGIAGRSVASGKPTSSSKLILRKWIEALQTPLSPQLSKIEVEAEKAAYRTSRDKSGELIYSTPEDLERGIAEIAKHGQIADDDQHPLDSEITGTIARTLKWLNNVREDIECADNSGETLNLESSDKSQ